MSNNTFAELLSNLKFLSKIKKDQKINVRDMFIQENNWTTSLSRTVYKVDNRKNTLHFIQNLINNSFSTCKTLINNNSDNKSDYTMAQSLLKGLLNSRNGIQNLKYTYKEDIHFACVLDTIIENINVQITEFNEIHLNWDDDEDKIILKTDTI
jgi:hypothetical protein